VNLQNQIFNYKFKKYAVMYLCQLTYNKHILIQSLLWWGIFIDKLLLALLIWKACPISLFL